MDPEPDFPAAHSMDTEWYAVDQDGHVGLFDSGEEGAVPEGACTEDEIPRDHIAEAVPPVPYRLLDWLGEGGEEHHIDLGEKKPAEEKPAEKVGPSASFLASSAGIQELPVNEGRFHRLIDRPGPSLGATLLFLKSVSPVRQDIEGYRAEQAPASEGVAVLFWNLPVATAWKLHEAGACLGCFPWPGDLMGFYGDLPRQIGLFVYANGERDMIAAAYERSEPPTKPLKLDDLPDDLRAAIGRVRFEGLSFAEAARFQPIDHAPCQVWGNAYLDQDGRTVRPIPGREDEFDPEDWADDPDYRVEMPPPREGGSDGS